MKFKTTNKVRELTGTRKREFHLDVTCRPQNTDSYWSEGSKSDFLVHNLNTGGEFVPSPGRYPWTTSNEYTLQPGDVLIETGTFCGKPATPSFLCLPNDEQRVKEWLGIQGA